MKIDEIVKSQFNDWIPAFAGLNTVTYFIEPRAMPYAIQSLSIRNLNSAID